MAAEVDAIPRANMLPHFKNSFTYRFAVAHQAGLQAPQADPNLGLGLLVSNRSKPFGERHTTICGLISEQIEHRHIVAYKLRPRKAGVSTCALPQRPPRLRIHRDLLGRPGEVALALVASEAARS